MSEHWRDDEVTLRRRLLFRLLKDFNYDNPIFQHELISAPIADMRLAKESDAFVLDFKP